jgi:hypothetical protein
MDTTIGSHYLREQHKDNSYPYLFADKTLQKLKVKKNELDFEQAVQTSLEKEE